MKIAYITSCFGTQSHTFIRREIRALRALGVELVLFGVRKDVGNLAPDGADLIAETHYLYPLNVPVILRENFRALTASPARYIKGMLTAVQSEEISFARRMKMLYHYWISASLVPALRQAGITHLHSHFMNVATSVAMFAGYHARLPFSATVHSAGTYKTPSILGMHQKVREAQGLVMISHYNVDYIDAIEPCRAKSTVIRCGMDMSNFDFRDPHTHVRNPVPKLLAVGRFVDKKGFTYLLDAAAILKQRGIAFSLEIIGSGPLDGELRSKAERLQLAPEVSFSGAQPTDVVRTAMAGADVVIVPSVTCPTGEKEGLPVVIMEAMVSGVTVVATEHSGIPEIVIPGKTGRLVPEKEAEPLADAIFDAMNADNSELIINARQLVDQEFNIEQVALQRRALFEQYAAAEVAR